jgi:nucleosome binding factor SPN SPT16 subunit
MNRYASYKKETLLPNETRDLRLLVDRRNLSLIVPIYGLAVPFHINTIKNITKTEDRDHVYLRFNCQTPGQTLAKKDATALVCLLR